MIRVGVCVCNCAMFLCTAVSCGSTDLIFTQLLRSINGYFIISLLYKLLYYLKVISLCIVCSLNRVLAF